MKKILVIFILLAFVCTLTVGCKYLPEELLEKLGISSDDNSDNPLPDGDDNGSYEPSPDDKNDTDSGIENDNTDNNNGDNGNGDDNTNNNDNGNGDHDDNNEHVHTYTQDTVIPTCTVGGYTIYTCGCGNTYTDNFTEATGHDEKHFDAKYPDCTEGGWKEYVSCTRCDYTTYDELPATGHFTTEALFYELLEKEDGTLYVQSYCELCSRFSDIEIDPIEFSVTKDNKDTLGISEYRPTVPSIYNSGTQWYVITAIGDSAFKDCMEYTEINLPGTLTVISTSAFEGCVRLANITIPEGVNEIGAYAFKNCGSLTSIEIPGSVETISNGAFLNCSVLKTVTLHEGLVTIGEGAFQNCSKFSKIVIPDTVITVGTSAFKNSAANSIIGGKGIVTIGEDAFASCKKLNTVFFSGTKEEFEAIDVADGNGDLFDNPIYYYSETKANGCWYYNEFGSPQPW